MTYTQRLLITKIITTIWAIAAILLFILAALFAIIAVWADNHTLQNSYGGTGFILFSAGVMCTLVYVMRQD